MARTGTIWGIATLVAIVACRATPAGAKVWEEEEFWKNPPRVYTFDPSGPIDQQRTVVGENLTYQPEKGDTFLDVARYYDIGFNEIFDANPTADEWLPALSGKPLTIAQEFVLPCCRYSGIVINVPEMRLYYYPPRKGNAPPTVITFPVGLGREDWKTPIGKFSVREKNVNPTWVIPETIRKERIADKGFSETMIPGGDPMNPLGKYRMRLTLNLYGIHGTNIPWGVGMLVSHGCVRLYPEDIERFFPMVPVGMEGEFVYQTVKVGVRDGRVIIEVHKDLYGTQPGPWRQAIAILKQRNLLDRVDQQKLMRVVETQSGVATDVSPGGAPAPEPARAVAPGSQPPSTGAQPPIISRSEGAPAEVQRSPADRGPVDPSTRILLPAVRPIPEKDRSTD